MRGTEPYLNYSNSASAVHIEFAGTLRQQLNDYFTDIKELVITGRLNADDVVTYRQIEGLEYLNLLDVEIVDGVQSHYSRFDAMKTKHNELSKFMFRNMTQLEHLVLPSGITTIDHEAFICCESLVSIFIPKNVSSIGGEYAHNPFALCKSLEIVNVSPDNNHYSDIEGILTNKEKTTLLAYPHKYDLEVVMIPEGIDVLGKSCFAQNKNMSSLDIPNSIRVIGEYAFGGCSNMSSITIPESVAEIGDGAFMDCYNLTEIVIPQSVTKIEPRTFCSCVGLTSVSIPASVTEIQYDAFQGCKSLKLVVIPNGVSEIAHSSFANCENLTSINIPDSVTRIIDSAFSGCKSLATISIPDSVTAMEDFVFLNCSHLQDVEIGAGVKEIGWSCFEGCTSLPSITIPDNVSSIGSDAFSGCTNLKNVTLGAGIKGVYRGAFDKCECLHNIYLHADTPPELEDKSFYRGDVRLHLPKAKMVDYMVHPDWQGFKEYVAF